MTTNILIIIRGYPSIQPKPNRKAYLNLDEEDARARFLKQYPDARDVTIRCVSFEDELTVQTNGEWTSP